MKKITRILAIVLLACMFASLFACAAPGDALMGGVSIGGGKFESAPDAEFGDDASGEKFEDDAEDGDEETADKEDEEEEID